MSGFHFSPRPNRAGEIAWREWGDAAFAEAQSADKPILLAISAVWCHWCHVMDETSYSDDEVIRRINADYIPVRVDNDQRPDVNRRYNLGGWPTTAFLTPDGEILNGGTYIPPEGMRQYTAQIATVWRERKGELLERLREATRHEEHVDKTEAGDLSWAIVDTVGALIRGQYDPEHGGFGRAPKFPQPKLLRFLIDEHRRSASPEVATMLQKTLAAMAGGGMYDPVEGGFFRYSTTREWGIPHFEKMLEDNSELLAVYAEAARSFPGAGHDRIVSDVIRWMDTVLWRDDVQGFSGSQDADEQYYALDAAGRAGHDAPYVDRTLYASWNALAASGHFAAFAALGSDPVEERAHDTVRMIATRLTVDQRLMHFDAGGGATLPDLLVDLAACLGATIDAYETGRHPDALRGAEVIGGRLRERLEDPELGGFWDAPERAEPGRVSKREKPIEDGAAAADGLLRLAALTGEEAWRESALRALRAFVGEYRQWGQFAAAYGSAVARALADPLVTCVVGPEGDTVAAALWSVAVTNDDPARSLHRLDPARDVARLGALGYPPDRTAAYVCVGTTCSAPLTDPAALERELVRGRGRFRRGGA
ncbi:MAG TPA: DUF255 domain-containing protein [Candidatus Saccharimonadales bacterium]|nr:DUF255 domain-containing protein [Candidatus Saccharimonadales bacterium]